MNELSRIRFSGVQSDNRKTKTCSELCRMIENRKLVGIVTLVVTLGVVDVWAQQPKKVPRIGYLNDSSLGTFEKLRADAFRQGLRELGYEEGKNIVIDWRYAEGKQARAAAELMRQNVDIIVTAGGGATRVAKNLTSTIPIIMTQDSDPVANGFVASLARPAGNITGLSRVAPELSGKQVELMKEIVPKLSRLAVFGGSTQPASAQALRDIELAAGVVGVKLQALDVQGAKDIERAFHAATKERADAGIMLLSGPILNPNRPRILELAAKNRLPVIYRNRVDVEAGGLISYGVHLPDLDRRAATYVDKILKGAKPADLPVEQPTKFEFVINLKTAKQIGLAIPANVLARADKVIR
jgi:putative tryptophan/tyrosine transport system substrate-binding protein